MVVLMIGIAVTLIVPQLTDIGEVRARGAMRRLQGTVKYLFNESIFRKRAFLLHIDMEKGEYWVETPQSSGGLVENVQVKDNMIEERGAFPEGVKIVDVQSPRLGKRTDGVVTIQFFPNGYVEPATIHIEDQNKNKFTFFIQPLTGKLKILDGHVEITRSL